jgi:hypothetical protein
MIFALHIGTQRKRWDRLSVIFQKEGLEHGGGRGYRQVMRYTGHRYTYTHLCMYISHLHYYSQAI